MKVLIADDHPVVREGLRRILEAERNIEVCGEAATGEEVLEQANRSSPEVVLLDLRMPGMGGIEALRQLKQRYPSVKVLCLTLYGDQYLQQAIAAGASGYLVKEASRDELLQALKAVHQGESYLHPSLGGRLWHRFASFTRVGKPVSFSPREKEILKLLAQGATNKEIGEKLYLSDSTIKREVKSLFYRLGVSHRAEAVNEAHKQGLL